MSKSSINQQYFEACEKFKEWFPSFQDTCFGMGEFGLLVQKELKKSGCHFSFKFPNFVRISEKGAAGEYYLRDDRYEFRNEISFGHLAFQNKHEFFLRAFHEVVHAIQYLKCATLYADFCNKKYNIVLCPEHKIVQTLMIERDAYTMESLFWYFLDLSEKNKIEQINEVWRNKDFLVPKLIQEGKDMFAESEELISLAYIDKVLDLQEELAKRDDYSWRPNTTFIRLCEDDLWILGNSFNVNSLYSCRDHVAFLPTNFNSSQLERLKDLNRLLGITDINELPTLGDSLEKSGLTKEVYLKNCRR